MPAETPDENIELPLEESISESGARTPSPRPDARVALDDSQVAAAYANFCRIF